MRPPARWPLHPAPVEGEALSSWLYRIAECYRMPLTDLLERDLDCRQLRDLDGAPPAALLDALAHRSGLSRDQLHAMTLAGLTPWLLDTLEPNPDPAAFDTYVRQLAVLLPRHERRCRTVPGWRAWLPKQPVWRACPCCLQEPGNQALLLVWTLPLLLSCPLHGCWLETHLGLPGFLLQWERPGVQPRPASAAIARMDGRTWQALTCGAVDLPQRRVHAGLWFRLLRTLLDELSAALSLYRGRVWEVRSIWERCGHPVRAGLRAWRPYETLDLSVQLHLLEAAAVAIGMIESGDLTGSGTEVALFLPDPVRRADRQKAWVIGQELMAAADEAIAQAKRSPEAARNLFQVILYGRTDADAIEQARKLLAKVGVPAEFLFQ